VTWERLRSGRDDDADTCAVLTTPLRCGLVRLCPRRRHQTSALLVHTYPVPPDGEMSSGWHRHNVEADVDKKQINSAIQTWSSPAPMIYHGQTAGIGRRLTEKLVKSQRLLAPFQRADLRACNTLQRHVQSFSSPVGSFLIQGWIATELKVYLMH